MNTPILDSEIRTKQQAVQRDFKRSQQAITIAGMRRLFGNTFIAFGTFLYGAAESYREELADRQLTPEVRGA